MFGVAGVHQSTDNFVCDLNHQKGQPGLFRAALFGFCPDCGSRTLFESASQFASQCSKCGLDYGRYNVGDGAAAIVTIGVAAIIILCAILVDNAVRPSFSVHAAIWIPVTVVSTIFSMRLAKGAMLITKHRRSACAAGSEEIT